MNTLGPEVVHYSEEFVILKSIGNYMCGRKKKFKGLVSFFVQLHVSLYAFGIRYTKMFATVSSLY